MRSVACSVHSGPVGGPTAESARLADAVDAAVSALGDDRLVAFPTETVWGLAACAGSEAAMQALRTWKGRDADQPVSVLVSSVEALDPLGIDAPPDARRLAARVWPGPLTLVLPARRAYARGVARADGATGVRCSSHPVAAALARAAERAGIGPLTATSLNRSGEPPAGDLAAARALCRGEQAPHVLDPAGDDAGGGAPTSVLDMTTRPATLLREGGLDAAALSALGIDLAQRAGGAGPAASTPSDPPGEQNA